MFTGTRAVNLVVRRVQVPACPSADIIQGGRFAITPGSTVPRLYSLCLVTAFLALLPGSGTSRAQNSPAVSRLTFTKTLKGSSPEYFALSISANGQGSYDSHKLDDPPNPRPLQISEATTSQIFSLVQSLKYLRSINLDRHLKVANMGLKTLTYQDGNETNKVQYNYTENHTAQQLTDLLERISNVEDRIGQLEYAMRYDHLSLPQVLLQIQEGMDDHLFAEPGLMIPTLEKISSNPRFLHLAQSRAQDIMQRIQQNK